MTDQYFRPKNWDKHQGWRKRGATWIKNYTALLDDPDYLSLPPFSALVLHRLWLLCGRHGRVLALSSSYLGNLLGLSPQGVGHALRVLIDRNFIELCEKTVALYSQESSVSIEDIDEIRVEKKEVRVTAPPTKPARIKSNGSRGTRLPEDWQPGEQDIAFAKAEGFNDDSIEEL